MSGAIHAEVGRMYSVPCLFIHPAGRVHWMPRSGWVPLLGPKHDDRDTLDFEWDHYHVDWRFMPPRSYELAVGPIVPAPHGRVITNDGTSKNLSREITTSPVMKRRKCYRAMPDFPARPNTRAWRTLEEQHRCVRLKPGGICPHRGIALAPFAKPDGTAICPGHGLRWNLASGELVPHHTAKEMRA